MLIDLGTEISGISSQLKDRIIKNPGAIPTLPLSSLSVHNAIGEKNMKVNKQVLLPIKIGQTVVQTAFIVIPQLNENGIIDNDFLENNKCLLDFDKQEMTVKISTDIEKTKFIEKKNGLPANLIPVQTQFNKGQVATKSIKQLPKDVHFLH